MELRATARRQRLVGEQGRRQIILASLKSKVAKYVFSGGHQGLTPDIYQAGSESEARGEFQARTAATLGT